jgi:hypothetical protein
MAGISDPAYTYTLEDFVQTGQQDQLTYSYFSVVNEINGIKFTTYNIVNDYLDELKKLCVAIPKENITVEQVAKYKYKPDLLSFDIYGSTQLDFIILYCNNIIDPKEFDFHNKYVYLPKASVLQQFLSEIYNADYDLIRRSNMKYY